VDLGPYTAELTGAYHPPDILARLRDLRTWLESPSARTMGEGRNRHVRIERLLGDDGPVVMVKAFGERSWLHDARDRRRGSKARRTWLAAEHLRKNAVGTPAPIGYLDRWEGGRLRESYYLAAYQDGVQTFRDALITLFHDHPDSERFLALLECVAKGVRAMHDAGFVHNDLGNQNILLTPDGPGRWRNFQVVDLNRGRIRHGPLGLRERARDMSRLALPSHLLQIFMKMYFHDRPPRNAVRWQELHARLHAWRVRSRSWRHPIREARLKQQAARDPLRRGYPAPRDMWIWDERTGQPLHAMLRDERARHFPTSRYFRLFGDTVRAAAGVRREYRPLVEGAFRQPVALAGRIGMAIDPSPALRDRELALLAGIGRIPAFVRFYHHETRERRRDRVELVNALHRAGHAVAIALVQDRNAVRNPSAWRDFATDVLEAVAPIVESVEVGHSVNRTKWGIWGLDDVRALYAPVPDLHARYPTVRFIGPAAIDFDYTFVLSALREWPVDIPLSALSYQLYVDRRGAPENPQNGFALVEKLALARAIARSNRLGMDRVIVSEVNWPVARTAPYSPVGPPYVFPWQGPTDVGTSEDEYADYMIRYLALALASGLTERVYWWRLVARGFGLVDDSDSAALRPRPAYPILCAFHTLLGDSTFVSARLPALAGNRQGRYRLAFRREDGETVVLTYAHGPALSFPDDEKFARVDDAFGRPMDRVPAQLTGRPVYLRAGRA
jgi:hypothetical protein